MDLQAVLKHREGWATQQGMVPVANSPRKAKPEVRVRLGEDWVSYRLRVATLCGATTYLVLRYAPDGGLSAAIEYQATDTTAR